MAACVAYDAWKTDHTIDTELDSNLKKQINFWSEVLTRITDVTLTLASCNLVFREHREKIATQFKMN